MGLAEDIAEHTRRFLVADEDLDALKKVVDERANARAWSLDIEEQIRVVQDALSKTEDFQKELADALNWIQPVRDSAGLVLLALSIARGRADNIKSPGLFGNNLDWAAWKLNPDLQKIQGVFQHNEAVRTAFAKEVCAYPGKKNLKQVARLAVEEIEFERSQAEAVGKVLELHLPVWTKLRANLQHHQFLAALKEDRQFRQDVVRETSYQGAEAKQLAFLAMDMLRTEEAKRLALLAREKPPTVPPKGWFLHRIRKLIDWLIDDHKTAAPAQAAVPAALAEILQTASEQPNADGWHAIETRLAEAFTQDPDLSTALWKRMNWPYPFALVLREELKQIESKRAGGGGRAATGTDVSDLAAEMKLFGVAFSGGGIRSATFNLGVLQKLAEFGLLRKIDYLSTVSGGGYIGAWLAGWIRGKGIGKVEKFLSPNGSPDPRELTQKPIWFLREFSNYLTPALGTFSFDTWAMFAVYTRNVLLNQATLFALIGAILLVPRLLVLPMMPEVLNKEVTELWMVYAAGILLAISVGSISLNLRRATEEVDNDPRPDAANRNRQQSNNPNSFFGPIRIQIYVVGCMLLAVFLGSTWFWRNIGDPRLAQWRNWWLLPLLLFMFLSLMLAGFGGFWQCYGKRSSKTDRWSKLKIAFSKPWMTLGIAACCAGLSLCLLRVYLEIMLRLHQSPYRGSWNAEIWGPVMLLTVLVVPGLLQVGLMGVDFPDAGREWMSRFRGVCSIYAIYWVGFMSAAVYGPLLVLKSAAQTKVWISGLTIAWVFTTVSSFLAGSSKKTGRDKDGKPTISWLQVVAKVGPPVFVAGLVVLVATLEQLVFAYEGGQKPYDLLHLSQNYWPLMDPWLVCSGKSWFLVEALSFLAFVAGIMAWRIDINEFSMHHFYKNRLVRCYLGASHENRDPNPFTGFDDRDDFALSSLKATHSKPYPGPYPIINTTLNLSAGKQLAWQERKAASFIFTPCFCGFDIWRNPEDDDPRAPTPAGDKLRDCAYRDTMCFSQLSGPHLGTAVSISGAAANPNQGYNTSPAVAFLMTIFNVRLGWWVGNPRLDEESTMPGPRFGLAALVSEMLGRTDDRTNFVNLSDGGHFDNMGIYELVRRRCRFIVLCDAEQDALYRFGGLGMAIRKCRVDFGAQIDIDTAAIKPGHGTHLSDSHCAVGSIRYLDGSHGTLVYIKASLTGDEQKDVIEYHANQPHFPHESTADQWFKESQFESYRALGYHATDRALTPSDSWQPWNEKMPSLEPLFDALEKYWYPLNPHLREGASRHTATLAELLDTIQKSPGLQHLGADLFPNSGITPQGPRNLVEEFYFCMSVIQLVEDLYFEFELDRKEWLDDPRIGGWRYLFRTWKDVPTIASTWAAECDTFREDFQRFWNNRL